MSSEKRSGLHDRSSMPCLHISAGSWSGSSCTIYRTRLAGVFVYLQFVKLRQSCVLGVRTFLFLGARSLTCGAFKQFNNFHLHAMVDSKCGRYTLTACTASCAYLPAPCLRCFLLRCSQLHRLGCPYRMVWDVL